MDDSAATSLDPVTVSDGPVRVERTLEVRELGVIAAFAITCSGERAVRATVVDYLPGNWRVGDIGFHGGNRPDAGTATSETVRFEVTVEPGEEVLVVYGVTFDAAVDVEAIGRAQSFSKPRIASVEPVGVGESAADEGVGEEGTEPSAEDGEEAGKVVETREAEESPEVEESQEVGDPREGAVAGERVDVVEADAADYPDDPAEFFDRFRTSTAAEDRREGSVEPPAPGSSSGTSADDEPDIGEATSDTRREDRSLVAALTEEIESEDVDDEAVGALRDALVRKDRASTRMRLQRIESRQEEFGAYVDALRELIDEHGPAAEFVGELLASIEDVEEETAALRDEVEAAADERASIREELAAETDALGDRLAAVEDAVDGAVEEVDALAGDLAETDEAARALEAEVASLAGEVESLRDRVEEWESTRRRLLDVLESEELPGPSEPGRPDRDPDDGTG